MKYLWILFLAVPLCLQAQQTAFGSFSGPLSSCPVPVSGRDFLCDVTGAGWEQSINGASYTSFSQPSQAVALTVKVGTVTTLAAGSNATVSVDPSSTSSNVVLNFGIPSGPAGASGASATIAPGTVTLLPAGTLPTVANSGTASAAIFNFALPVTTFGSFNCPGNTYSLTSAGLKAGPGCIETTP